MKKILKWFSIGLLLIVLVGSLGFILWAVNPSQPGADALAALQSDKDVTVRQTEKYIVFEPVSAVSPTGFIFYPGGHVEYRAYAPILHMIAARGFLVVLVPVRLNLAFFDIEAGAPALDDFPQIKTWVAGGHSLGGVASALFAEKFPQIRGLIYWASYPANANLKNSGIRMLSIYGTRDGGLKDGAMIKQYSAFEPDDTIFVVIKGGNHGQFADYGPQPGDNPAEISSQEQWRQTTDATVSFLKTFNH